MANTLSTLALFSASSAAAILKMGLEVGKAIGLPVESWQPGDPTRANFQFFAQAIARLEGTYSDYIRAGFLSTASGDWLKVLASEVYGVEAVAATYATPSITLQVGATTYFIDAAGDFQVRSTATGKTYQNTTGGITLSPGATVTLELIADEPGSDSSTAPNELDDIVSPALLDVAIVSSTAASARDEQDDTSLKEQCAASRGALAITDETNSQAAVPLDGYEFVARSPDLTGALDVTRARAVSAGDAAVTIYVAGASGPVLAGSVTAVQAAIEKYANAIGFTPTVVNSTAAPQSFAITVSGSLPLGYDSALTAAVQNYLKTVGIGRLISRSLVTTAVHKALPGAVTVDVTSPAADVQLAAGVIPTLDAVAISEAV